MDLSIEIIPNSYEFDKNDFSHCLSKITINGVWDVNVMILNSWTEEDYLRQWKDGLERIKTQSTSCLVASVVPAIKKRPLIFWWILYKENDQISINNCLIINANYKKLIGNKVFSPETCYDFITPKNSRMKQNCKISELIIKL